MMPGRGGRALPGYLVAGLVPLCLLAALVLDRAGELPAVRLEKNPALQAAADLERAGERRPRLAPPAPLGACLLSGTGRCTQKVRASFRP